MGKILIKLFKNGRTSILLTEKIRFWEKYKEGHLILIKVTTPQAHITVLNLYTFNNMASD